MVEAAIAAGLAFLLSIVGVKLAHPLGLALGMVDLPDCRKVHCEPLPRSGGLLLVPSLVSTLVLVSCFYPDSLLSGLLCQKPVAFVGVGLLIIYSLGAFDDKYQLPALVKLAFQIVAVTVIYAGGVKVHAFNLLIFSVPMDFWGTSYLATLFWCLLIINAINLIDGLDGLAAGLILFTSVVIAGFSLFRERMDIVVFYAVMGGSMIGFLFYNFNPASIFLGDCGSYSLGYMVATMSLLTGTKSQLSTSLAIPLITLGIPVFDAIISGIRRFVFGRSPFAADKGHVHHRLLSLGLTQKRAVGVLYGVTIVFAILSILAIVGKQSVSAVAIVAAFVALALFLRRLRYFEHLAIDRIYGWLRDVIDVTGISHARRGYLGLQHAITRSKTLDEVWENISLALVFIRIDYAEVDLCASADDRYLMNDACSFSKLTLSRFSCQREGGEGVEPGRATVRYDWSADGFDIAQEQRRRGLMKMECPLVSNGYSWGTLWLVKDLKAHNLNQFTLRRIEQLRRTLIAKMDELNGIQK